MALKAFYELENVNDSSGNNYTLTNVNSVTFTSAKFGKGANFGSSNSNKYLYTSNNMGITGALTMMGWFKCLAEIGTGIWMFTAQAENTSKVINFMYYDYNAGTRRLAFQRNRYGVGAQTAYYNITLGTSNWYHITFTYDLSTIRGYINGQLIVTRDISGNGTGAVNEGFAIARSIQSADYYASIMADRVKVYNEALPANGIVKAYEEGLSNEFFMFF